MVYSFDKIYMQVIGFIEGIRNSVSWFDIEFETGWSNWHG